MNIILVHPIHGAKVAISEQEMEQDVKNGWTLFNADISVKTSPDTVTEVPKRKYTRKVSEQPIEHPNEVPSFLTSVSDESEGK